MAKPYDPLDELKKLVEEARKRRQRRIRRIGLTALGGAVGVLIYVFWPPSRPPEPCSDAKRETLYAQRMLALRSRPDSEASVKGELKPDQRVVVAQVQESPWVQVCDGGRPGTYAFRSHVTLLPVEPELPPPLDTTAICSDSTPSFSRTASGTCSGGEGVLCWIKHPKPVPEHLDRPYCKAIPIP